MANSFTRAVIYFSSCAVILVFISCGKPKKPSIDGKYVREYTRIDFREIVLLRPNGTLQQVLYQNGKIISTNDGFWIFISSNTGQSKKWSPGKPVFIFSEWIDYDLAIHRSLQGNAVDWSKLPPVETSAIKLGIETFAFDLDGASLYKK